MSRHMMSYKIILLIIITHEQDFFHLASQRRLLYLNFLRSCRCHPLLPPLHRDTKSNRNSTYRRLLH